MTIAAKNLKIESKQPEQIEHTHCTAHDLAPGLTEFKIAIQFQTEVTPAPVAIEWLIPLIDIAGKWHPRIMSDRSMTADWCQYIQSYATLGAPVYSLFSEGGENRQTFALSDAINPIEIRVQVEEDTAEVKCEVILFNAPTESLGSYTLTMRMDTRPTPYHQALENVAKWWESMPEYKPAFVPDSAFDPVYSTWYSFHQDLSESSIEEQCEWSVKMGCKTVIVDDGWQTEESNKGYQFCGDWEIAPSKFPTFKAHVKRIQNMDMRYMLWFSVPYAGRESVAWQNFKDRMLPKPFRNADCFDPRYPKVRRYLIDFYRKAIEDWKLDGLKLDFVDQFTAERETESAVEKTDMRSVPAAADRLLSDMMLELQAINPNVLIEFRQSYIGPAMRKYGNILRAQDCPNDALSNRIRTIDVRLLAGNTAVHSDMIMWHREETPERAALQLWAALFSVPQVSVKDSMISLEQNQMLRFFMNFWLKNRDLLVKGDLIPLMPQYLYPIVYASNATTLLAALYQPDLIVPAADIGTRAFTLVNATESERVVIDLGQVAQSYTIITYDCMGNTTETIQLKETSGLQKINVCPAGIAEFSQT